MARFKARVSPDAGGGWIAAAVELPNCWSRGRDADEALAKLRDEIRYRIEYCPCTGVADDFVQLDVVPRAGVAADAGHARDAAVRPATWRGVAGCPAAPEAAPAPAPARRRSRWSD